MNVVFQVVLAVHVLLAIGSAALFWPPVFTAKGSPRHVRTGRLYHRFVLLATGSSVVVSGLRLAQGGEEIGEGGESLVAAFADDPARYRLFLGFLVYIAIATAAASLGGVRALRRGSPRATDARLHEVVAGFSVLVLASGAAWTMLPMVAVGAAGLLLALVQRAAARRAVSARADLVRDHLTGMIASGVLVHSALAIVVANRVAPEFFHGPWGLLVWLAPTVVGLPFLLLARARV